MTTTKNKKNFISLSDVLVLAVVISVKISLIDWYFIPSGSMLPTLQINDRVIVDKDAYSLRIPLLNHIVKKNSDIERGDIVVFEEPSSSTTFIKRVVGLGGDTVEMNFHNVLVNGTPIKSKLFFETDEVKTYQETVGKKDYLVNYSKKVDAGMVAAISSKTNVLSDPTSMASKFINKHYQQRAGKWVVPEGYIFVMGDNRDNSVDSRFSQVSFIKEDAVKGRASFVAANMKPLEIGGLKINIIPSAITDFNKDIYTLDPITLEKVTNKPDNNN